MPSQSPVVSQAFSIEASSHSRPLENALAAIDRVHRDGALPTIPLQRALLTDKQGQFVFQQGGPAVAIQVSYFTSHAEMTTVHEVGHFLDYHGLGNGTDCASISEPLLQGWRNAVRESQAVQSLGRLWQSSAVLAPVRQADGSMVEYPISRRYLQYLLRPEELWARCYAQFIAVKSGAPTLRRQLDSLRVPPPRAYYYPIQWDDDDFALILAEMEAMFRQKGWMTP